MIRWQDTETSPKDGSLNSFLSDSGRLSIILFLRSRNASEIAAFRRKEISYCLRLAAAAPSSGAGVNMIVGRSAMMNAPSFSWSATATPGSGNFFLNCLSLESLSLRAL